MNIKNTFKHGLFVFLLIMPFASKAEEDGIYFSRYALHSVDVANNVYLVSAQLDYRLSKYLEKALLNGIPIKVSIVIGLGMQRSWWWNQADSLSTISYQVKYHALSQHFLLTRYDTNENWNFRSLSATLRKMGSIVNYKLPPLPETIKEGGYYIYMGARMSPATLRLPLRIQSLFSDEYSLSSEVVSWPLP